MSLNTQLLQYRARDVGTAANSSKKIRSTLNAADFYFWQQAFCLYP